MEFCRASMSRFPRASLLRQHSAQLRRLFLRKAIADKASGAAFAGGEVLETSSIPQNRVKLDVQMRLRVRSTVGGSLMHGHHVWHRHIKESVIRLSHHLQGLPKA